MKTKFKDLEIVPTKTYISFRAGREFAVAAIKPKEIRVGMDLGDEKFDEAPHAKTISNILGTEHTEYYCTHKEALDIIPKLPDIYDEPLGDNSVIPTTLVSQMAVKDVTVALSGDGRVGPYAAGALCHACFFHQEPQRKCCGHHSFRQIQNRAHR